VKKVLVSGGCGFVGSNLTARLIELGMEVTVFDNLSRHGTADNLKWLQTLGAFRFVQGDTRVAALLEEVIKDFRPDAIFHLAGQVAMTTSMRDPRQDFETNVVGTFNLLEAVRRHCPGAVIVYASSNKVYGELAGLELREEALRYTAPGKPLGIDESFPLDFQTPYGCSKGAADQYMLDYARVYDLNTIVFRHSTIYGGRQYATFDQGWVGWFCQQALEAQRHPRRELFTISGNGKQVRDLLYIDDAVNCYLQAAQNFTQARGRAFNIGGGMENSCSLLELFQILEERLGIKLTYKQLPWRPSDQKFFVADSGKAFSHFGWNPLTSRLAGVEKTLEWARQSIPGEMQGQP
jgi:CDP-paratose 2-epimerase